MKGLKEVLLDNSRPKRTTRISTLANPPIRQALTAFLMENQDVFTWSHEDMPRIYPSVIVHKLNVSLSFPPICKKKQIFVRRNKYSCRSEIRP